MDQALIILSNSVHPGSARIWKISFKPADNSKPALGKDVSGTIDFDAMKEYCIIVLPGGEVLSAVLSEKGMQTEQLNISEKEIQSKVNW